LESIFKKFMADLVLNLENPKPVQIEVEISGI